MRNLLTSSLCRSALLIAILLASAAGVYHVRSLRATAIQFPNWSQLPYTIDSWRGADTQFEFDADPADSSVVRVYQSREPGSVFLYVGFHRDVPGTLVRHTPDICYPSQGWSIHPSSRLQVGDFRSYPVPANMMIVDRDGERRLVVWWYESGSKPFEGRIRQVLRVMFGSMFTGHSEGAFVRLETPIRTDEQSARERLVDFSKRVMPHLEAALPN